MIVYNTLQKLTKAQLAFSRFLLVLIIFRIHVMTLGADNVDVESLPLVKKVVAKAKAEVRKNRKLYDDANSRVFVEAEKALRAEVDRLSKAGMPDEAVAVKRLLADFRRNIVDRAEEESAPKQELTPQDFTKSLVGKWRDENTLMVRVIDANGGVTEYKQTGDLNSKGRIRIVQPLLAIAELDNKYMLQLRRRGNNSLACTVVDPQGNVADESVLLRVE